MEAPLALITGGSRGLGYETAKALALKGFNIGLIAKDLSRLELARAEIKELITKDSNQKILTFACDLENSEATSQLINSLKLALPVPDVMILAHGVMSAKMSKTLKTDYSEWRRVMAINLDSVFQLVNGIAPAMVENRNGRVIIFSACLGRMSGPGNTGGLAPYRISKAGVNALVRNLAHETGLGSRGFLVDAICPNHSRTDMGGSQAPLSAEEGAQTAIWLATRKFDSISEFDEIKLTGQLWEEMKVVPW